MSFIADRSWTEALKIIMGDFHVNGDIPNNMPKLKKATPDQLESLLQYRHGISYPAETMLNYLQPFTRDYTALLIIDDEKTNKTYVETLKGRRLMEIKRGPSAAACLNDKISHVAESIIINLSEHQLTLNRWSAYKLAFIAGLFKKLADNQFGKKGKKK